MDLFYVETGTVPGQSCNEETMPVLKRGSRKDEPALTSKAFLINDSLACATNLTVTFADPSKKVEGCHIKRTSPVKQRGSKTEPPKSPEYLNLSPRNLEDPVRSSVQSNVMAKASDSEKDSLLKRKHVLNDGKRRGQYLGSNQLQKDEQLKQLSAILTLGASQPDQPSTSSAYLKGNSPTDSRKKKTLGELAEEWKTNKSPGQTKADGKKVKKVAVDNVENDEALVRNLAVPCSRYRSNEFISNTGLNPNLMEIKPVRPARDPWLLEKLLHSPDEELIRHHEYHSPRESKIATAMRLSQDKINETRQTTDDRRNTAKQMTLAELAKSSFKEQSPSSENKLSASSRSASSSFSSPSSAAPTAAVRTPPNIITEETSHNAGPLVRHSEFYKGSINVMRRPSSDSQQSFQEPRERGGSTLADLIQQKNIDDDSFLGSNLGINEDLAGSRESIYSTDGVYGNHDVKGEILLGYQYVKGSFKVKIFEARGLTAVDKTQNTSNPYVKVYLLPDQSRAGKRKTKTKYGTLDPQFNEEMLYKISTADLVRRTVWICLWHYDRFGRNDFLGEVRIPLGDYRGSEVAADWYPLLPLQSKSSDNDQGELVVGLMYSPADKKRKSGQGAGKLYVKIIEARNLAGKDADNLSDPFCKSYLLPDPQKKSKRKTQVKKRNLNPRWDYKFSYDNLSIDELQHRVLELTVWDHDLGTSNDFIGGVRIGLGTSDESWDDCTGEEVTLWQFLLSKPNTWTESTLPLRSEMGSRKGLQT